MQVSSAQSSSAWSSLAFLNRQATPASTDGQPTTGSEITSDAAQEADLISLNGNGATPPAGPTQGSTFSQPPEVFAEIWKDGTKIGVVYTDGQAMLPDTFNGVAAGSGGTRFPYLRAAELSQQLGGEVRYVNIPALQVAQTRAQLRAAYGS